MGIISRRVLPACGSLCIFCPELRARSRQPVKRYKKLLTQIFPKSQDELPNDRKIGKLTEYAAKNPLRIPKIAGALEQRGFKDLRSERYGSVRVVMRTYSRLLVDCRDQMPLFAASALNMIRALLEQVRQDDLRVLGCMSLVDFLQNQTDSTYMHNLEAFLPKLCDVARERGEEAKCLQLRAAGLQALASMVSYMGKYSQISSQFETIVGAILDNYENNIADIERDFQERRGETSHSWVQEVLKAEGRTAVAVMKGALTKLWSAKEASHFKDPTNLNRKEMQLPNVWSQICVQNLAYLSKEGTTVRRILDPMFHYFDEGRHWLPEQGLSVAVLRDLQYFMEKSGNEQFFLPMLVKHLDDKAVVNQTSTKTSIVEIIGNLVRLSKSKPTAAEIGAMSDLLSHLCNIILLTLEPINAQGFLVDDLQALQTALEDCLNELLTRVQDIALVLDMMASKLEKLSSSPKIARATLDAVSILACSVASSQYKSYAEQLFPEALLQQILKAMMHSDIGVRVRAHRLFSLLLVQPSVISRSPDVSSTQKKDNRHMLGRPLSFPTSADYLLKKLGKDSAIGEQEIQSEAGALKEKRYEMCYDMGEAELRRLGSARGNSKFDGVYISPSRMFGFKPTTDKAAEVSMKRMTSISHSKLPTKGFRDVEMTAVRLSGHQAALLLSVLWLQASLHDNGPFNFEAISHTYKLTLMFSRPKTSSHCTGMRAFQLALCLRSLALGCTPYVAEARQLPPSRRRSLFMLSTAMLVSAGQAYNIHQIIPLAKGPLTSLVKDPYLNLSEDLQLSVASSGTLANFKNYGLPVDDSEALKSLSSISHTSDQTVVALANLIAKCSATLAEPENYTAEQILQPFVVERGEVPQTHCYIHSSHSLDCGDISSGSHSFDELTSHVGPSFDDDFIREDLAQELPQLLAHVPFSTPPKHAISVSQLMNAALPSTPQEEFTHSSKDPLSYSDMASSCKVFDLSSRKKISCILRLETESNSMRLTFPETKWRSCTSPRDEHHSYRDMQWEHPAKDSEDPGTPLLKRKVHQEVPFSPGWLTQTSPEPWQLFHLPPASPYDNFLKAACY